MSLAKNRRLHALLAILLGIAAGITILVLADIAYRIASGANFSVPPPEVARDFYSMNLGYRPMPRVTQHHTSKNSKGEAIFAVDYFFDVYGRRTVREDPKQRPKAAKHALFFVDSNVFGEGIPGDATIPAVF